jgi:hypothetical protein
MSGLSRELHGAEIERLEAEQDSLEFELGSDGPRGSKRWSGSPWGRGIVRLNGRPRRRPA